MVVSRNLFVLWCNVVLTLMFLAGAESALAEPLTLTIKNQAFTPQTLTIKAGTPVKIFLKNADVLPAEFESNDLGKEKVIPGNTTLPLFLEALSPGKYQFFNDFHPSSTGTLVVEKAN